VLDATTYDEAAALHRDHCGGLGLSVQTWRIVPRMREVDAVAGDPRLVEVHPELSFARLAGRTLPSKHRAEGRAARLHALRAAWPGLPETPAGTDAPDALAAAWSALRWLRGGAETLPPEPPVYGCGRPMRMVV
jgi:predicted RNase H-like nuclease